MTLRERIPFAPKSLSISHAEVGICQILDYTTRVPVARTVAEIEAKLARAKAWAILKEYDSDGTVSALSFRNSDPNSVS